MTSTIINRLKLATGIVGGVGDTWKTVRLPYFYKEMVVVATPCYNDDKSGAVVRIRNANLEGKTFEVRVENPKGDSTAGYFVNYVAMEAGISENADAGIKIEAQRINSLFVDGSGSWRGQTLTTASTFNDPVVLGQVMTNNDAWSVFWAQHLDGGSVKIGRHIGEDPRDKANASAETLGVIVIEAGRGEINGIKFKAGHTPDMVVGRGRTAYAQSLGMYGLTAVASPASRNGGDGYWPVLWGENRIDPFGSGDLDLTLDEDQVKDSEQGHVAEKVAYLALNGEKDGARFLAQAGFGGDFKAIRDVSRDGYAAWIDDQKSKPQSKTRDYMEELVAIQNAPDVSTNRDDHPFYFGDKGNVAPHARNFSSIWMRNIVHGEDILRQRVAWALSQIFVISYNSKLKNVGISVADYYDMLSKHALGNFRDLLLNVSIHPAMAYYLSSLGNQKGSDTHQPDENFAREVMQLFTIGLWKLNDDGTPMMDGDERIPTYDNRDITELARVFTGLWYEGKAFKVGKLVDYQGTQFQTLSMFKYQHDRGAKTIFHGQNGLEFTLPEHDDNREGMDDIEDVIDQLCDHPNTPPFIARRLIQFLVTSNPSSKYVKRVADRFRNNGEGVRGDLHAVIKQILLDTEVRNYRPTTGQGSKHGKLVEPMMRIARLVKAFQGDDQPLDLVFWRQDKDGIALGQWPMLSNSVFNFFEPDHQKVFVDEDDNTHTLYSPEFQILNPVTGIKLPNELALMIDYGLQRRQLDPEVDIPFILDFTTEKSIAHDINRLLSRLDTLLTEGQMSDDTWNAIKYQVKEIGRDKDVEQLTDSDRWNRVRVAVWGVLVSPDCAIMR